MGMSTGVGDGDTLGGANGWDLWDSWDLWDLWVVSFV
jgi:hypothetical protein